MRQSRLTIAKPDILKAFEAAGTRVFRERDIASILARERAFWRLAQSTTRAEFVRFLLRSTPLKRVRLDLPHRPETLYAWGDVSPFVLASSSKRDAYLCHYTAMHLHDLTDQVPETIYANHEQPGASNGSDKGLPPQHAVDRAFARPQRVTTNIAPLGDHRLCLINGQNTGRLGVVEMRDKQGDRLHVTDLERTLIDIAVRPAYAGGVFEVLGAFRRAASRVSLNKLAATLKKLDFVYPYEQAVGFYLERSGAYEASRIGLFLGSTFKIDFYLTYAMEEKDYSERWRLFFPKGL